jgi:hypothetical protein
VALPAPAKISISRAVKVNNSSSNNRECHRPVQLVPVKVSINPGASVINASNSWECRHPVKKVAFLGLRAVLTAKVAANTKPRA